MQPIDITYPDTGDVIFTIRPGELSTLNNRINDRTVVIRVHIRREGEHTTQQLKYYRTLADAIAMRNETDLRQNTFN